MPARRITSPTGVCSRDWISEPTRMNAKRTNASAAEYPMFHHRKPCWYISSTMLSVLFNGPPCVMTYGSAKSWK